MFSTPENLIRGAIRKKVTTDHALRQLKAKYAGKSGRLIANNELTKIYTTMVREQRLKKNPRFENLLIKRRVRTLSGVSPVAVLTGNFGCPGKCVFCPTERGMPKSYLSNEPAVMRAIRTKFDPYDQIIDRLRALTACGHPTNKVELIVMGGTWSAIPRRYQSWFIRRCMEALNESVPEFPISSAAADPNNFQIPNQIPNTKYQIPNTKNSRIREPKDLQSLQRRNESSLHRLVGLTLETRPDFITPAEVRRMLALGCTRVELGAQSLDDEVLKLVKRGHTVAQTIRAIKLLKNAGLKIGLHLMPNLPGSTPKKDLAILQRIFSDPDFAPDQLKIYPCVVTPYSELEQWWRAGKYKSYSDETLTNLLAEMKTIVPPWIRLSRIIRDIPAESILAGSRITNLRQILQKRGVVCECIRCREIRGEKIEPKNIQLVERRYPASGGEEIFLSFEDVQKNKLIALLRLRLPEKQIGKSSILNLKSKIAFIRELHTYGAELEVTDHSKKSGQHRGYGKKLILAAEKIARESGARELRVTSGVGVRPYYRALGYKLSGFYMRKQL